SQTLRLLEQAFNGSAKLNQKVSCLFAATVVLLVLDKVQALFTYIFYLLIIHRQPGNTVLLWTLDTYKVVALTLICEQNRRQIKMCGMLSHKIFCDAKDYRLLRKITNAATVYLVMFIQFNLAVSSNNDNTN
ncbi:unnamed protein product, partial [Callosobruchus maculatus]